VGISRSMGQLLISFCLLGFHFIGPNILLVYFIVYFVFNNHCIAICADYILILHCMDVLCRNYQYFGDTIFISIEGWPLNCKVRDALILTWFYIDSFTFNMIEN
jgi:hypothetical protein